MNNKITAALLAFFLGGFGIHRFYLGQTGLGIWYLLFSWTAIPAIIGFVDCILFLTMSEVAFNDKYNQGRTEFGTYSTADELQKLYDLKERGVITEQEFETRKSKLL